MPTGPTWGQDVLERAESVRREKSAAAPEERVGVVGAADRPIPMSAAGGALVTYACRTLWIVNGFLAVLFGLFFGWVFFLR